METLVRVTKLRWSIERSSLKAKELLERDHCEHRSWQGWHRHMPHAFLQKIRMRCFLSGNVLRTSGGKKQIEGWTMRAERGP
ncbi:MAG: hypothetical protein ACYDAM_08780 [Leptospirales bacterium]